MTDSSQISRGTHRILVGSRSVAARSGAPLVLVLGVLGQWVDSRTFPAQIVSTEIHALFGLILCAAVFTHVTKSLNHASSTNVQDIARFSRSLSRKIYLLMYLLLGLRIALGMDRSFAQPAEGFRDYLIGGILALVLVRVLSARKISEAAAIDARLV